MSGTSLDRALRDALAVAPLAPSDSRQELAELAKGYLAKFPCLQAVRSGEPLSWRKLAKEQGWQGLALPEKNGGLGLGFAEMATVIEQCGRALAYPELVTTAVLGAALLAAADNPGEYLTSLATGGLRIAVAGGFDVEPRVARLDGDSLTGFFPAVVDAPRADLLLIPCSTRAGTALYAVAVGNAQVNALLTLDLSRSEGSVTLDAAPGALLVPADRFGAAWRSAQLRATVALAVEQLGGAGQALELTLTYVATREQFGRPIGSFQAIKHRCADLFVELQSARSAVEFAVWAADSGHECLPLAASIAKAAATDAFRVVS